MHRYFYLLTSTIIVNYFVDNSSSSSVTLYVVLHSLSAPCTTSNKRLVIQFSQSEHAKFQSRRYSFAFSQSKLSLIRSIKIHVKWPGLKSEMWDDVLGDGICSSLSLCRRMSGHLGKLAVILHKLKSLSNKYCPYTYLEDI